MKLRRFNTPPWAFSFLFAAIVFVLIIVVSGRGGPATLSFALSLAPYLVLVGLGQMLVISAGAGNIDVSVASILSLAAYVSVAVTQASGSWVVGMFAAVATGIAISMISVLAITFVRIPPIVATLASGLIATSFTLSVANGFSGTADADLKAFVNLQIFGIPVLALATIFLTVIVSVLISRTTYGRRLLAVGQARRAADYAGVNSGAIVALVYLSSGALAGLSGALLAAYIAPTPDLGGDYLLDSIAVVVVGGTLISGGRAVPAGVWGGAMFFILLDSLLNLIGWNLAGQNILKGFLLLAVLFLAGGLPKYLQRPAKVSATPQNLTKKAEQ